MSGILPLTHFRGADGAPVGTNPRSSRCELIPEPARARLRADEDEELLRSCRRSPVWLFSTTTSASAPVPASSRTLRSTKHLYLRAALDPVGQVARHVLPSLRGGSRGSRLRGVLGKEQRSLPCRVAAARHRVSGTVRLHHGRGVVDTRSL